MTAAEVIHLLGIWAAAVFGLFVVFGRKGTWMHKWNGRGYVAAMLVVCFAALGMLNGPQDFSVTQALSLVVLLSLSAGALAIRRRAHTVPLLSTHGYAMAASMVCLAGLAAAQLAAGLNVPPATAAALALLLAALCLAFAPVRRAVRRIIANEA